MSEAVIIELIRAAPVMLSAGLSFATAVISLVNHQHLKELKVSVNSSLHDLLTLTAKSAKAEGVLEEQTNPSGRPRA